MRLHPEAVVRTQSRWLAIVLLPPISKAKRTLSSSNEHNRSSETDMTAAKFCNNAIGCQRMHVNVSVIWLQTHIEFLVIRS